MRAAEAGRVMRALVRGPLVWGLVASLAQIALCLVSALPLAPGESYFTLARWDAEYYETIVSRGYYANVPMVEWKGEEGANVAFFPGYPLWAWVVSKALFLEPRTALLVAAQSMAVAFWALLFALLGRITSDRRVWLLAGLLVAAQPSAFFLQAAYSESTFMAAMLAFLWAITARPPERGAGPVAGSRVTPRPWLAMSSGVAMTATRIVGVPLAMVGFGCALLDWLVPAWRAHRSPRALRQQLGIGLVSLAGVAAFFLYCEWRWGEWNLYMQAGERGWGIRPEYLAMFDAYPWRLGFPRRWAPGDVDPEQLSRFVTSATLWLMLLTGALELLALRTGVRGLRERLPFYAAAFLLLFMSLSGRASIGYVGMIRYVLPVHVSWLLGVAALGREVSPRLRRLQPLRPALVGVLIALIAYALLVQWHLVRLFMAREWVA